MLHTPQLNHPSSSSAPPSEEAAAPSSKTPTTTSLWKRRCQNDKVKPHFIKIEASAICPSECLTPQASNRSSIFTPSADSHNFFPQTSSTPVNNCGNSTPRSLGAVGAVGNDNNFALPNVNPMPTMDDNNGSPCTAGTLSLPNLEVKKSTAKEEASSANVYTTTNAQQTTQGEMLQQRLNHYVSRMQRGTSNDVMSSGEQRDDVAALSNDTSSPHHEVRISDLVTEIDEQDQVIRLLHRELRQKDAALAQMHGMLTHQEDEEAEKDRTNHRNKSTLYPQSEQAVQEEHQETMQQKNYPSGSTNGYISSDMSEETSEFNWLSSSLTIGTTAGKESLSSPSPVVSSTTENNNKSNNNAFKGVTHAQAGIIQNLRKELTTTKDLLSSSQQREQDVCTRLEEKERELEKKERQLVDVASANTKSLEEMEKRERLALEEVEKKEAEIAKIRAELTATKELLRASELLLETEKRNAEAARSINNTNTDKDSRNVDNYSTNNDYVSSLQQEIQKLQFEKSQEEETRKKMEQKYQVALKSSSKELKRSKVLEEKLRASLSDRATELKHQLMIETNLKEERQRSRELQRKAIALKRQLKAKATAEQSSRDESNVAREIGSAAEEEMQKRKEAEDKLNEAEDKFLRLSYDLKKEVVRRTEAEKKISAAEVMISTLNKRIDEVSNLEDRLQKDAEEYKALEAEVSRMKVELEKKKGVIKDDDETQKKEVETIQMLENELSKTKLQLEKEQESKAEMEEKFSMLSMDWSNEVEARMQLEEKLEQAMNTTREQ